jgi:methyl-accepting chemotaxis protein
MSPGPPGRSRVEAFLAEGKALFDGYRARHAALRTAVRDRVRDMDADEQVVLNTRLAMEALVGLGALGLLYLRHRRLQDAVVDPVEALRSTMARVGQGDLAARPTPSGAVELEELGHEFWAHDLGAGRGQCAGHRAGP